MLLLEILNELCTKIGLLSNKKNTVALLSLVNFPTFSLPSNFPVARSSFPLLTLATALFPAVFSRRLKPVASAPAVRARYQAREILQMGSVLRIISKIIQFICTLLLFNLHSLILFLIVSWLFTCSVFSTVNVTFNCSTRQHTTRNK